MKTTVHYQFEHEDDNRDAVTVVCALELRDAVVDFVDVLKKQEEPLSGYAALQMLRMSLLKRGVLTLIES